MRAIKARGRVGWWEVMKMSLRRTSMWKQIKRSYYASNRDFISITSSSKRIKKMRLEVFDDASKSPEHCKYVFVSLYPSEEVENQVIRVLRGEESKSKTSQADTSDSLALAFTGRA